MADGDGDELPYAWVSEWGYRQNTAEEKEPFWSEEEAESKVAEWKESHENTDDRWYSVTPYQLEVVPDE